MKINTILISMAMLAAGCQSTHKEADAYGNFEATEVIVSAETSGRILTFDVTEGQEIAAGSPIAVVDTLLIHHQDREIQAVMESVRTRIGSIDAQNEILKQQIANLSINIGRTEKMLKEDAATQKQYDDLVGQVAVLQKQMAANNTQQASVAAELAVSSSKQATLREQLSRGSVKSPIGGTILEKYAEAGEMTTAGRPLVKIADLSVMKLKVYVSGAQLSSVKTGKPCTVRIDNGKKGFTTFPGTITHIAERAEFTPKIIQTKEDRVTLVYAVTIEVKNDGSLKSGMPGEAIF